MYNVFHRASLAYKKYDNELRSYDIINRQVTLFIMRSTSYNFI